LSDYPRNEDRQEIYFKVIRNIPNILTISRIALTPLISSAILIGNFERSITLLAIASLTDFLDGYIARKYNLNSPLGSVLDPMADKILISVLTISLTMTGLIPFYLCFVILGRDLFLTIRSLVIRYRILQTNGVKNITLGTFFNPKEMSGEIVPSLVSKINTALQLTLIGSTLVCNYLHIGDAVLPLLQYSVCITTIWSALDYTFISKSYRLLK
jgi:cardiolipin synthase